MTSPRVALKSERVCTNYSLATSTPPTPRLFVIGCLDTALEHHQAIWLLAKSGLHGSAFAFVRLVYDAMLRALWLNKCAYVEQIEQASRDELQWRMGQVRDDIKQAYCGNASQE